MRIAARLTCWRRIILLTALFAVWPPATFAAEIFVISRERVVTEVTAAQQLRRAEAEMTAALQAQIERAKEALSAEENELAGQRQDMEQDEFRRRAANFDRRVRITRRVANERAAEMKKGFQEASVVINNAIPEVLEQIRIEAGAEIILDADQVITFDPDLDLTDRLIEEFNKVMPVAPVPEIDLTQPILAPLDLTVDEQPSDNQ